MNGTKKQELLIALIEQIQSRLTKNLPGARAQANMAPAPDLPERFDLEQRKSARKSAVLILLYQESGKVKFPLIVRQKYEGVHSGQVALPGGKYEQGDDSLIATALREAEEEIGVERSSIQVLGALTDLFVPPSNFNILPVVGWIKDRPVFNPEAKEVNMILEADLNTLLDPAIKKTEKKAFFQSTEVDVPYYHIEGQVVWGATAMILSEFETILNNINN